jgi:hypothetical protein
MALTFAKDIRPLCRNLSKLPLRALPLLGISLAGCSTCVTFTSNSNTGTVNIDAGDPKPACMLTKANATVRVAADTAPACSSCLGSRAIQHIFVSLLGIEVHPSAIADEASPDWQELMPQLPGQPLQVDLMSGAAALGGRQPLGEAITIPAGTYRQLRLRFAPNQPASDDALPEKNACGGAGFNCVVMADGRIQPLLLQGAAPEVRITSERIAGGVVFIPPDSSSTLIIEFIVSWSLSSSAGEGVGLLPGLVGTAWVKRQPVEQLEFDELVAPAGGAVLGPRHDSVARGLRSASWLGRSAGGSSSKIFATSPASATPKIRNGVLVSGSAPP